MPAMVYETLDFGHPVPDPYLIAGTLQRARVEIVAGVSRLWELGTLGKSIVVFWEKRNEGIVPTKILNAEEQSGWPTSRLRSRWDSANHQIFHSWSFGQTRKTYDMVSLGPFLRLCEVAIITVDEGVRKLVEIIPIP
jgi:hypothetical protein